MECNLPEERQQQFDQNQQDDDKFKGLALCGSDTVRQQLIKLRDDFQLVRNDPLPFVQVKALRRRRVQTSQIEIAYQLQGVLHAFRQQRGFDPQFGEFLNRLLVRCAKWE